MLNSRARGCVRACVSACEWVCVHTSACTGTLPAQYRLFNAFHCNVYEDYNDIDNNDYTNTNNIDTNNNKSIYID